MAQLRSSACVSVGQSFPKTQIIKFLPIGDVAMSRRSARGRKRRACKRQRPRDSLSVTALPAGRWVGLP
jgi:hypothetical protein